MIDQDAAHAALAALTKAERNWVLSLPAKEGMVIIRLLIAFPGARFEVPE